MPTADSICIVFAICKERKCHRRAHTCIKIKFRCEVIVVFCCAVYCLISMAGKFLRDASELSGVIYGWQNVTGNSSSTESRSISLCSTNFHSARRSTVFQFLVFRHTRMQGVLQILYRRSRLCMGTTRGKFRCLFAYSAV